MAGNPSKTLETSLTTTTTTTTSKLGWKIQYARFFNYSTASSTTAITSFSTTSQCLRSLPKSKKKRDKGTWISSSSSSTALLHLLAHETTGEIFLIISLCGKIYEEHFLSKLHFTWPQVSCLADCPVRGSRVVFAGYRDWEGQIQKFAMRFSTSNDSQTFISYLKFVQQDGLKDLSNMGLPVRTYKSGVSCPTELISSNGVHYKCADEELSRAENVGNSTSQLTPSLNCEGMQYTHCEETTIPCGLADKYATLQPSFTSLLLDCCTEAEQEQPEVHEEANPMAQDVNYMTESSFYSMLSNLEDVIQELGGDLSLRC